MGRLIVFYALLGVTLCLAGCLSTEVTRSETCGIEHIVVRDYGWKLFNWIPIFRSDITPERVQKALTDEAARRGKTAAGLVYHNYDAVMFDIPLIAFTIPVPYIFCFNEIQLSGVLK